MGCPLPKKKKKIGQVGHFWKKCRELHRVAVLLLERRISYSLHAEVTDGMEL